jgi:uncharacterized protein
MSEIAVRALEVQCPKCMALPHMPCVSSNGNEVAVHVARRNAVMSDSEKIQSAYEDAIAEYERSLKRIDQKLDSAPDDTTIKALTQRRMLAKQRMAAAKERFQLQQLAVTTRQADAVINRDSSGNGISRASNTPVPPGRPT